jgi:hypothetical protein
MKSIFFSLANGVWIGRTRATLSLFVPNYFVAFLWIMPVTRIEQSVAVGYHR